MSMQITACYYLIIYINKYLLIYFRLYFRLNRFINYIIINKFIYAIY